MNPRLERLFADYAAHHRQPATQWTHSIGIPLIVLALLGLGARVPLGASLDLGILTALGLVVRFATWHLGLGLGCALLLVPLYLLGRMVPTAGLWIVLAAGVALQYLGHVWFERNQPAFHRNAVHMLVGPLWIAARLFRVSRPD